MSRENSDGDRRPLPVARLVLNDEAEAWALRLAGKLVGYGLLFALLIWVAWTVRGVLPPFVAALLLSVALAPLVDGLEARRLPRWVAAALVYLVVFGVLTGLAFIIAPLVSEQIEEVVAQLRGRFHLDQTADVSRVMTDQIRILGRRLSIPAFVMQPLIMKAKNSASLLAAGLQMFGTMLLTFIPNLIWFVLVPIVGFYALIDYHRIFARGLQMLPRSQRDNVRGIAGDVSEVFSRYLRGLLIVCLLDMAATMMVLGIYPATRPFAIALGLLAGLLYAVPYLGAIFSTALIALVAFAAPDGGIVVMLWVTLTMVLLHQVLFDQVITPRFLGGQVGLHPILSILALLCGNALFGVSGMLLAVPAAASLQVIVIHLLPRLARKVEVKIQRDQPAILRPEDAEAQKTVQVAAGEGISGPATVVETPAEGGAKPDRI